MSKLSPEARALFDSARMTDRPSPADRARVRRALAATLAASSASLATTASAASASASVTSSAATSAAGMSSVGAAGTAATAIGISSLTSVVAKIAVVALVSVGATTSAVLIDFHSEPETREAFAVASSPKAGRDDSPPVPAAVPVPQAPAVVPEPAVASPAPAESPREADRPQPPRISSNPRQSIVATPAASESTQPAANDQTVSADTLAAELRLLEQAQTLRHANPERALAKLDEHRARFPNGALGPEREATRVLILCAIDDPRGHVVAARFRERHPDSPLGNRLIGACR